MLLPTQLDEPNPQCFICSSNNVTLRVNTTTATLGWLATAILEKELTMAEYTLFAGNTILLEASDDLDDEVGYFVLCLFQTLILLLLTKSHFQEKKQVEQQKKKKLSQVGVEDNTILRIEDDGQGLSVDLVVRHAVGLVGREGEDGEELDELPYELARSGELKTREAHDVGMIGVEETGGQNDGDDVFIVEGVVEKGEKVESRKKRKIEQQSEDGVIVL